MSIRLNPDLLPSLLASIQDTKQSETIATLQLSSGRSVNQLSDNPVAAALVLNHNQAAGDGQYLQNLSTLQSKFQVADSALGNVVSVLTRALSLGVEGANGTLNPADRQAIAGEVQGLLNQAVSLANTTQYKRVPLLE
jgi:flagellar hook-associated protein 3 FlgL